MARIEEVEVKSSVSLGSFRNRTLALIPHIYAHHSALTITVPGERIL